MGEYARYRGQQVKIGTCEAMYYLRADQARDVEAIDGSLDPVEAADAIRFRFPWPDEDGLEPGGDFADHARGLTITGVSVLEGVDHSGEAERCAGACPILDQQAWRNGRLVICARCSICGVPYRMPELEHALPILEWIATTAERSIVKPDQAAFLLDVARRIQIGYGLTSWPISRHAFRPAAGDSGGLIVGVRGSGHVIIGDRVPAPQDPPIRAQLTPAEARDLAYEIMRAADHVEAEQDRQNAEQAPQLRLECDEQRELAV